LAIPGTAEFRGLLIERSRQQPQRRITACAERLQRSAVRASIDQPWISLKEGRAETIHTSRQQNDRDGISSDDLPIAFRLSHSLGYFRRTKRPMMGSAGFGTWIDQENVLCDPRLPHSTTPLKAGFGLGKS